MILEKITAKKFQDMRNQLNQYREEVSKFI